MSEHHIKIQDNNDKKVINNQPKINTPVKSLRHPDADHIFIDGKASSPYPSTRKLMSAVDASELLSVDKEGLNKQIRRLKILVGILGFILSIMTSYVIYKFYINK